MRARETTPELSEEGKGRFQGGGIRMKVKIATMSVKMREEGEGRGWLIFR